MVEHSDEPTKTPEQLTEIEAEQVVEPEVTSNSSMEEFLNGVTPPQTVATIEEVFNPEIHASGPNGTGIITKGGKFRKKRLAGDKKEEANYNDFMQPAPRGTFEFVQMALDQLTMLVLKYAGKDWEFSIDEKQKLIDVYARYIHYKKWDEGATPETVVIGTTMMIIGVKLLPYIERFVNTPKDQKNAQTNNRPDPIRQDNPSSGNSNTGGNVGKTSPDIGPDTLSKVGQTIRVRSIG